MLLRRPRALDRSNRGCPSPAPSTYVVPSPPCLTACRPHSPQEGPVDGGPAWDHSVIPDGRTCPPTCRWQSGIKPRVTLALPRVAKSRGDPCKTLPFP